MTRRQILLALLPPLFFGTGFTVAKPAVAHFPPLFMMLVVYGGIAVAMTFSERGTLKTPLPFIILISAFAVTIQGALLFWDSSSPTCQRPPPISSCRYRRPSPFFSMS